MARYQDEAAAAADGFTIVHQADRHRYALLQQPGGEAGPGAPEPRMIGEAHYTLIGDDAIDFDHTVVDPSLRGTGLSGVLARRALTGSAADGRRILASCWFIEGYLAKHPELRRDVPQSQKRETHDEG
ncbi:N-acetyltransferase [Leucobacter sp. gxy201]|uniref:GNAT family N-acetyltransferase n=1 Tax=Leucobacter sp. gxy201 TaxID=2957200 RepID=UPI003D9FC355